MARYTPGNKETGGDVASAPPCPTQTCHKYVIAHDRPSRAQVLRRAETPVAAGPVLLSSTSQHAS